MLEALGPADARWTLLLTHGAGAPADSILLSSLASLLGERGVRVVRFEFPYMAMRRQTGRRRPPDRAPVLLETWREQIRQVPPGVPLAIGGHSMGGRYATLVAAENSAEAARVQAVVAFGYPFKPANAEQPRTAHLGAIGAPLMIVQGSRDPFGDAAAVSAWDIPASVSFAWIDDGDHSLVPRRASGRTAAANYAAAADAVVAFLSSCRKQG